MAVSNQCEIDRDFGNLMYMLEKDKKEAESKCFAETCESNCDGLCTSSCPFKRLYTPNLPPETFLFVCKKHKIRHRCGAECQLKECNHENFTCPLTGMVIPVSLIDEDPTSGGSRKNHAHANGLKNGDMESDKNCQKMIKSKEAIEEGLNLCSKSLQSANIDKEAFQEACRKYLYILQKNAKSVAKNITTKRSICHFSLAMVFMHRTGYKLGSGTVLFKKVAAINDGNLPKSHGLSKKKLKMRAITRIQDGLRAFIRQQVHKGNTIDKKYCFPDFTGGKD